ncbi:MAG TPA: non-canonical purine NTP pyrophosphatase [Patescibacteria group bacterium]|nr:non-canonical purine NTP pyrophosphatase [Patescibacteria group bacterium]
MKLFIATFNRAKQNDFKRIITALSKLQYKPFQLFFPEDVANLNPIEEIGKTFEENSFLKARYFFEKTHMPTVADDGGLEIPILHGQPGVRSRRWLGKEVSDEELIAYTLQRLSPYRLKHERTAYLTTCLTFYDGKRVIQEKGRVKGYIADHPCNNWQKGYPFKVLFILSDLEKYYDELTEKEHEKYNHREKALKKLLQKIVKLGE